MSSSSAGRAPRIAAILAKSPRLISSMIDKASNPDSMKNWTSSSRVSLEATDRMVERTFLLLVLSATNACATS